MDEKTIEYLNEAYKAYSQSLTEVKGFIAHHTGEVDKGKEHLKMLETKVSELAEMLGDDLKVESAEQPELELVE